jgi:hypothetical protein
MTVEAASSVRHQLSENMITSSTLRHLVAVSTSEMRRMLRTKTILKYPAVGRGVEGSSLLAHHPVVEGLGHA